LAPLDILPNSQAHNIAYTSGAVVGVASVPAEPAIAWQLYKANLRRVAYKEVEGQAQADIDTAMRRAVVEGIQQLSGQEFGLILAADAVSGFIVGAGLMMLAESAFHWDDYKNLMSAAQLEVDGLQLAYHNLASAFLDLPHPLSRLQEVADEAFLCRWIYATDQMNNKVLTAQHAVQQQQVNYDECWFDCGTRISDAVTTDLQKVQNRLEHMGTEMSMFEDCYPMCAGDVVQTAWDGITDDVYHVCKGVQNAICDMPHDEHCSSTQCVRFDNPGALMLLEAPQNTSMAVSLVAQRSSLTSDCGSEGLNDATDMKQLVRCTRLRISEQGRRVHAQRERISTYMQYLQVIVGVVWVFGVMRLHRWGKTEDYYYANTVDDAARSYHDMSDSGSGGFVLPALQKYCGPLLLGISMLAVGIVIACGWWLDRTYYMIQDSMVWMGQIDDDLDDVFASHPSTIGVANISTVAIDVSKALVSAIKLDWDPSSLPIMIS
jgi:hypothetical protein